jgi:hypothetical protein
MEELKDDPQHKEKTSLYSSVMEAVNQTTSHELCISIAIGMTGGVWPIPLTSYIGCFILQGLFCVRPALVTIIQGINFAFTPIELATFHIFIYQGESEFFAMSPLFQLLQFALLGMLGAAKHFDASTLVSGMRKDPLATLGAAQSAILCGLFAWCIFVPPSMIVLYCSVKVLTVHIKHLRDNPLSLFQLLFAGAIVTVAMLYAIHRPSREYASIEFVMFCLFMWALSSYMKAVLLFHSEVEGGGESYSSLQPVELKSEKEDGYQANEEDGSYL